ncbi:Hypothetical Protein C248_1827 [Staphylococcus aureus 08BA02176]|nr:Hypothetical Protein C248_1827 [Staphylococcus aureus 08BA02176]
MIIRFSIIGAPTQRISTRNSTSNARWGVGPQHREFQKRNSTGNARWGVGPQHRKDQLTLMCKMAVPNIEKLYFNFYRQ